MRCNLGKVHKFWGSAGAAVRCCQSVSAVAAKQQQSGFFFIYLFTY